MSFALNYDFPYGVLKVLYSLTAVNECHVFSSLSIIDVSIIKIHYSFIFDRLTQDPSHCRKVLLKTSFIFPTNLYKSVI